MEKFIRDNREKFMADLPAGHRERFAMKLNARADVMPRRRHLWFAVSSVAAAILLAFFIIGGQDKMQPYLYSENDKVAEMRMLYEQQLDKTVVLLVNILDNVDDSTRNEINILIENLNHTSEVLSEIAPLPEEK